MILSSHSTLIIGAAGSGKSDYAESYCLERGHRLTYLATMIPSGEEALRRIDRHRSLRSNLGFTTIECHRDLKTANLVQSDVVLLECLGNLVANELFADQATYESAHRNIREGLSFITQHTAHAVFVTNDVFCDGVTYSEETLHYCKLLGEINASLARACDTVVEVVCGIPCYLKGG